MDLSDARSQRKNLPIGIDDYKDLIDEGYVYIDKTLLIKEFWENKSKVTLVTRPRRFGKSISLSMLRYFFEKTDQSMTYLFKNSLIWKEESFKDLQGVYPVIFISFKDIKGPTWEQAYQEIQELLTQEILRTLEIIEEKMSVHYREKYQALLNKTANEAQFSGSLLLITQVLKKHTGRNTIVLIDEYDSPITHAYAHKFYDKMVDFMRQLLSKVLKGNSNLFRGFMTGVVRTAKDGILSGLNNLDICTMLDAGYSDKFGFTEEEIEQLLQKVGYLSKKEEIKVWYNGYTIGIKNTTPAKTYNPWSVLQYIKSTCVPETYWANTGNTKILENLVAEASEETQKDLQLLVEGKSLENKHIDQDVILLDLNKKNIEPWSFLFFAGYLTAVKHVFQNNKHYYTLSIPNQEIAELYKKLVVSTIDKTFASSLKLTTLLEALVSGNIDPVNRLLGEFVAGMCSSHDLPQNDLERSLHLFVLGLLASLSEKYVIKSNLESGYGRYDILMHPKNKANLAVIIEFKKGESAQELESLSVQALKQIKEKRYASLTRDFGYHGKVFCYGVAVFKKHLIAKLELID